MTSIDGCVAAAKFFNSHISMTSHSSPPPPETMTSDESQTVWYRQMSNYHWFVFLVCSLGWAFDCFDQQLFAIVRTPALAHLMNLDTTHEQVAAMGGYATSLMLIGWATGGILFGIMGDKYGRAKTMIFTILTYAVFTGMSGLATSWWDFLLYRFLTGLGVGGQFAAGVTLLAETMPDKVRPKTLGMLQMVAAFGNISAALLNMLFGYLEQFGIFGGFPAWRFLFFIGFLPALLAIVVMRHLEEPKKWKEAMASGGIKNAGSISDLFRDARWRYNVIVGMILATCGVIGLWGIGFFSIDLTRTTLRNGRNNEARASGEVEKTDFEFVRMLVADPEKFMPIAVQKKIALQSFIDKNPKTNDPGAIFLVVQEQQKQNNINLKDLTDKKIIDILDRPSADGKRSIQTPAERTRRSELLSTPAKSMDATTFANLADSISKRAASTNAYVSWWAGITSLLFNAGAFFGTLMFVICAERFGRRIAFTIAFGASFFMTILVFLDMDSTAKVIWMTPLLGCCTLSLFGGYAIYFPELFPTHLRSTAVSFCYNIGRFVAATGPAGLGLLTTCVFYESDEPIRLAGAAMSITFIFGIIVTWFGPETKGKPLPE
ncbi:MAG: MFS transporter [Thermoguttaceae bacterium]